MPAALRRGKAPEYTSRMPWLRLTLVALALAGCSVITLDLTPRIRPLEEETVEGAGDAKILLMEVAGFLSDDTPSDGLTIGTPPPRVPMLVRIREELKKAADDPKVRALVVRINTPGGTVTASDIIYSELQAFRARTRVPIVAVMMDVAASGGYYVALAADTIVAHPTTVTGSIGVIMLTVSAEGLLQKIGVGAGAIKSGEHKDMGSPFRAMTAEERAIFQSVIDDLHRQFVARLVERRRMTPAAAAAVADGRIFTAEQALRHGLVDRIGYVVDGIDVARRAAGVERARVVVYKRPREYRATYYARAATETGTLAHLAQLAALVGSAPKFLYLWAP
ncbi:MAG TPA: signal peptide peptidase SppA [Candidatus Tectomicrobia bacterium]|nr:signal peptide peptidase SppA [Candidatus Tectomicrobia bacterium]